jgi:hypothetical protein
MTRWLLVAVLAWTSGAQGQDPASKLNLHKAAFLYHFANYVTWPPSAQDSVFAVGILGASPLTPLLQELAKKKKVGDRSMAVQEYATVADAQSCQLLFVTEAFAPLSAGIDSLAVKNNVLTVSDATNSDQLAIHFVLVGDKLKFAVDREALLRADLRASAHLLKLAIAVR